MINELIVPMGITKIVPCQEVRNGKLWFGGYTVKLDADGVEISRTEPVYHFCIVAE